MDRQQIKQLGTLNDRGGVGMPQNELVKALSDLTLRGVEIKDIRVEFIYGTTISGFNILIPYDVFDSLFPDHEYYDDPMWLMKVAVRGSITYQGQRYKIKKKRPNIYTYPHG